MKKYKYHPVLFYTFVFIFTWIFWILSAIMSQKEEGRLTILFELLGLLVPSVVALCFVFSSKNKGIIKDFKEKIIGFYKLKPKVILFSILLFTFIVVVSILFSLLFGQSLNQFSFCDFSFSVAGTSALATIILASTLEEVGWRGYGEDSIANYCTWFKESFIFGFVWSLWHIPLFFVVGSYQYQLRELGGLYVANFFISTIALGFLTTFVYVKNNRSMLASMIFHFFVNFMQEKIAMTPQTKCVETIIVILVSCFVVCFNKDLFFEKNHIDHICDFQNEAL